MQRGQKKCDSLQILDLQNSLEPERFVGITARANVSLAEDTEAAREKATVRKGFD